MAFKRGSTLLVASAGAWRSTSVALLFRGAACGRVRQDLRDVDVVVVLDRRWKQRRLQLILLRLLICILGELGWTRQIRNAHTRVAHRDSRSLRLHLLDLEIVALVLESYSLLC